MIGHKKPKPELTRRQRQIPPESRLNTNTTYHSRRADQDVTVGRSKLREQRLLTTSRLRRLWRQRFTILGIFVLAVIILVSLLRLSSSVKISVVGNQAALLHTSDVYAKAASNALGSSLLNKNKLTVDTGTIRTKLLAEFPEISDVSVTLPLLGDRPTVYLQPTELTMIITNSSGAYVLDDEGKALLLSHNLSSLSHLKLPVVTDQSGLTLSLNKQALTSDNIAFVQMVLAQLTKAGVQTTSLTLPASTSELDVRIAGQPYYVKFNLQTGDARQQAGTYLATIAHLKERNITPTAYVDVRVDGRAYYK